MKIFSLSLFIILVLLTFFKTQAQSRKIEPSLAKIGKAPEWKIYNREVTDKSGSVYLNSSSGNGILWNNEIVFSDGIIEVDLKGKDVNGESFIGIAFHIQNDSTYEAIYFRPFNFQNPDRNKHAVQYISHPVYTWDKLRKEHPRVYESSVDPIPDPNEWFHARIEVNYPEVKVFVNDSNTPSLEIEQISNQKAGYIGFWVGNYSDGQFRNLSVHPAK